MEAPAAASAVPAQDIEEIRKAAHYEAPPDVPEDFSEWLAMAEKSESAPFHIGDLPPEDNQFGSYYVPRKLGPDDKPLPEMPWDSTGPCEAAKPRILGLLKWLRADPYGVMVIYFERMPKNLALCGFYNLVFDLENTEGWTIMESLKHLKRGDVIEMAVHNWTLLVREKAWYNIYEDPAKRQEYWRLEQEKERKYEETLKKKSNLSVKQRLMNLETCMGKEALLAKTCESQRQAIQILLMLHTKYKFNSEMMENLRENVAHHEREGIEMRKRLEALMHVYKKLIEQMRDAGMIPGLEHLQQTQP